MKRVTSSGEKVVCFGKTGFVLVILMMFLICSASNAAEYSMQSSETTPAYAAKKQRMPFWKQYSGEYPVYPGQNRKIPYVMPWNENCRNPAMINPHLIHFCWGRTYMIKLMTYNTHAAVGIDNHRSVERIADVIRQSGADIVCLQEVDQGMLRSDKVDQPAIMARILDMNYVFQGNLQIDNGLYGVAVLTKFDIVNRVHHLLTSVDEQRGALEVQIRTPEGPLTVFCTHLGLEKDERAKQAIELAALVNAVPGPRIVCGDFNEEAKEAGVSTLISQASLTDVDPEGNLTFDSVNPECRIDMILCSQSVNAGTVKVLQSQASDHMPLIADICIDQ